MRHPESPLTSIGELVANLRRDLAGYGGPVWYRGHRSVGWRLEPKLLRPPATESETHLINRFKQHASLLLPHHPGNEFDWLFLMQHHGLSTRLLDWSENPLVGLYFAVEQDVTEDSVLWMLLPTVLNSKSNIRPAFEHEIPSFEDEELKNYLPSTISREIRSRLNPVAAIAPRNSPRMQAQQGVFTITHRDNVYIDEVGEPNTRDHIWRYLIPGVAKADLRADLRRLGITKFSVFPELSSITAIV
ncbi:hypothetical protein HDF16_003112 [Granulicella aggregans]|uniref:FRG domain-containing protein n=1 Tax=Granulicella aggregans TaxID=474949 RepID=A0A7W8E3W2_9BACT|nr:FRG domain-containing protein [Granulicella aggregans]MBB5058398.1 hypothetical protein [Granulicella aggregans]